MKTAYYIVVLLTALSLAACGVRRDLKLPDAPKPAVQKTEAAQPENVAP